MTVGRIAIGIAFLLAGFALCEWNWTKIPAKHHGNMLVGIGFGIGFPFAHLAASCVAIMTFRHLVFPDAYFATQPFEREGKIYKRTGILLLVSLFRLTGYERSMRKSVPVKYDLAALRSYSDVTRGSEANHLLAGICMAVQTISLELRYPLLDSIWFWLGNILVNAYPVMLQRYNRPRVERIIRRLERNSKECNAEQQS